MGEAPQPVTPIPVIRRRAAKIVFMALTVARSD